MDFLKYLQYISIIPQLLGAIESIHDGQPAEVKTSIAVKPNGAKKYIHFDLDVTITPNADDWSAAYPPKPKPQPKPTPAPVVAPAVLEAPLEAPHD